MPELPEVETTLRGIKPHIYQQVISDVIIRKPALRFPIPKQQLKLLKGEQLTAITRRAKYLLLTFPSGTVILHLGMSGRLRVLAETMPAEKHDHVDIHFANQICLRFTDPRRFGAVLFTTEDPDKHPLLKNLGPEPLTKNFDAHYLWELSRKRAVPIKNFIMDSKIVVGVGNIYAAESLFLAGIHPQLAAGKISLERYEKLTDAIKLILKNAIKKGGTTLKDFLNPAGNKGYFSLKLQVYGREKENCFQCKTKLQFIKIAQRSTVYCKQCQA